MENLKCRTEELRKEIVEKYYIELINVVNLIGNRTKKSDAGGIIKNRCYEFICTSKIDKSKRYITCGKTAGESLIRLAGIKDVVVFNPFKIENEGNKQKRGLKRNNDSKIKWNKTAQELYNAINILEYYWDRTLKGILYEIKKEMEINRDKEPSLKNIKKVNKCISADRTKLKISEMILKLREKDERFRDFYFKNINNILEKNNIESYFS
ncbi:hypothetical protein P6P37_12040 [Clostridium perfringens]|uniref:hypothetical protein n=1 Tax=Clostridium perfringens TaxID=1502 RepID=UPI0028CEF996|nr:hypothetical protein [Clostridium perfringens]MDK0553522.1 hypothetical protein [Clostridium perfringens]MDT7932602.1 hypothetical protein [Clostridium perfringens]MDT7956679.1 hypothetical protein [Clostridium perfringens]